MSIIMLNSRQPTTEEEIDTFLAQIRSGDGVVVDARHLYNVAAADILKKKVIDADEHHLINIIVDASRDQWLRCVAALALRHLSTERANDRMVRFFKRQFAEETDPKVKIALLFAIGYSGSVDDPTPYRSFVAQHREQYVAQNIEYVGGDTERWQEHSLSRLRDPRYIGNRWLYLLNLESLNYRGTIILAQGIRKLFPTATGGQRGIEQIDLEVQKGEFITIFGPNGCGKSTFINIIAGLLPADGGSLTSDYGPLSAIKKCYVWQNYRDALLPWRNAVENIGFPLKLAGIPKQQRYEKAVELMQRFSIKVDPKAKVYSLSGGEQQIVSILRGLIIEPEIMLLDEPFSALDYQMNLVMEEKIMDIWAKTNITTVFVSHDLDQAILLADRLVLLSAGPGRVKRVFENTLPRPRTIDMFGHPEHIALKKEVLKLFQEDL